MATGMQGTLSGEPIQRTKSGKKYWLQWYYDANGKRKQAWDKTVTGAIKKAQDKVALSYNAPSAAPVKKKSTTLAQFCDTFMERSKAGRDGKIPLTVETLRAYDSRLRTWIIPQLGDIEVKALTVDDIERFRQHLLRHAPSRSTARQVVRLLKTILTYAVKTRTITISPAQHLEIEEDWSEQEDKKEERIPSLEEVRKIDEEVRRRYQSNNLQFKRAYRRYYPMYLLLRMSGLRWSELCGLKWADVNTEEAMLSVRRKVSRPHEGMTQKEREGRPKSRNSRRDVPIPRDVIPYLLEWREHCPASRDDWMFPTKSGKALSYHNFMQKFWYPVLEAAGVEKMGIHTTRHMYASILLREGKIKEASTYLGHHSVAFTMDQYAHLIPNDMMVMDSVRHAISGNMKL